VGHEISLDISIYHLRRKVWAAVQNLAKAETLRGTVQRTTLKAHLLLLQFWHKHILA